MSIPESELTLPEELAGSKEGVDFLCSLLSACGGVATRGKFRNETFQSFVYLAQSFNAVNTNFYKFNLTKAGLPNPGSYQLSYDLLTGLGRQKICEDHYGKLGPECLFVLTTSEKIPSEENKYVVSQGILIELAKLFEDGKLVDLAKYVASKHIQQTQWFTLEENKELEKLETFFRTG